MLTSYKDIEHLPKEERIEILERNHRVAVQEQDEVQMHVLECMLNAELFLD